MKQGALKLWRFILQTLESERGEVGSEIEEDFSAEEREILGLEEEDLEPGEPGPDEEEAEPKPEDKEEEEPKPEEEEPKPGEEEEENLIPQSRFDKVYGEAKTYKEKLELLQKDPDKYYEQYPDEKPRTEEEEGRERTDTLPSFSEVANMRVKGGTFDGLTLREVHEQDPFVAIDLYQDYRDKIKEEQAEAKREEDSLKEASEKELDAFADKLSQEHFEKPVSGLSKEEADKITAILDDTLKWMGETGKGFGNIEDAYFLQHRNEILAAEKGKVLPSIAKFLSKETAPNISSSKGGGEPTGYEAYMNMSPDQLSAKIEDMSEGQFKSFIKKAPASLKQKFPGVDWDL